MDVVQGRRWGGCDFEDSMPSRSAVTTREVSLKLLLIGDILVGKTSFVQRYVNNIFRRTYKETIGVDFTMKVFQWTPELTIRLQLWDVAGMERLGAVTRAYYRNANGCLLMFDLTDHSTFNRVVNWKEDLDSKCRLPDGSLIPCLLVGNKRDLTDDWAVSRDDIEKLSERYGFSSWRDISVKDNVGVDEAVSFVIEQMVSQVGGEQTADTASEQPRQETTVFVRETPSAGHGGSYATRSHCPC